MNGRECLTSRQAIRTSSTRASTHPSNNNADRHSPRTSLCNRKVPTRRSRSHVFTQSVDTPGDSHRPIISIAPSVPVRPYRIQRDTRDSQFCGSVTPTVNRTDHRATPVRVPVRAFVAEQCQRLVTSTPTDRHRLTPHIDVSDPTTPTCPRTVPARHTRTDSRKSTRAAHRIPSAARHDTDIRY